jgi:hypothetical protein
MQTVTTTKESFASNQGEQKPNKVNTRAVLPSILSRSREKQGLQGLVILPRNQNRTPVIVTVDALICIGARDLGEILELCFHNVTFIVPKGRENAIIANVPAAMGLGRLPILRSTNSPIRTKFKFEWFIGILIVLVHLKSVNYFFGFMMVKLGPLQRGHFYL